MNMIILNKKNVKKIKKINKENMHLNRAIQPLPLKDGSYGVSDDVLKDDRTWANWIDFLSVLPQREVLDHEFDHPEISL